METENECNSLASTSQNENIGAPDDGKQGFNPEDSEDEYEMNRPHRGSAVIINNYNFDNPSCLRTRRGSDKDLRDLNQRFQDLGFDVETFTDLSADEMQDKMNTFAARDHSNNDCFVGVIMSHGDDGIIYGRDFQGADEGYVDVEDLIQPFLKESCPSLSGKPKLFFIQACRGKEIDPGVSVEDREKAIIDYEIIVEPDFLVCYSAVSGYRSMRHISNGTWFIQALCSVFEQYGQTMDLMKMMTKVNQEVALKYERPDGKKQMPCINSMLLKKVYFRPKQ